MTRSARTSAVLEQILRFNAQRRPKRVRLKLERMNADAFSFFRGTDHLLAESWPRVQPPDVGPDILQCGDLHLENFGAYQAGDGEFLYDINDFDEALVAPSSLDLVRGTASILIAAEMWRITPLPALDMALAFLDRYRSAVTARPPVHADDSPAPHTGRGPIWELLGETALASQAELLDRQTERTKGGKRAIVRSKSKHPALKEKREEQIRDAVESHGAARPHPGSYRVLDVTERIAGTGSLGVRRYIALIEGDGTTETNRLLDIKQCLPSSLLTCTSAPQPDWPDDARRVVEAQRALQAKPARGLDVLAIGDETYRIREMVPDDNRTSLSRFQNDPDKLRQAIEVAGQLTGWSHLRGAQNAGSVDRTPDLIAWASGPSLDAVLSAAARYAERARRDFIEYHEAFADPRNLPKELRTRTPVKGVKVR